MYEMIIRGEFNNHCHVEDHPELTMLDTWG